MNQTLSSIFETEGLESLEISKQNFSNDYICGIFIDNCVFDEVNLFHCCFEDSDFSETKCRFFRNEVPFFSFCLFFPGFYFAEKSRTIKNFIASEEI
jgi:hypothetical protein